MKDCEPIQSRIKVEIATSIDYGNYKKFKPIAVQLNNFIKANWGKFTKEFKLPDLLTIKIRPIKGSWTGWARKTPDGKGGFDYTIEVDPRNNNVKKMINTFFHELTHIDQYVSGRLTHKNGERIWCGAEMRSVKKYAVHSSDRKLQEYRAQPWEQEANNRGAEMSEKYWDAFDAWTTQTGVRL
jgi:hypothetical protein